jgi:RsiW-degrading membrane proteinase PrsW (M82 family)
MTTDFLLSLPVTLLPTLAFLALLEQLDSFKLVSVRVLARTFLAGALLAAVAFFLNDALIRHVFSDRGTYSLYGAPVAEELLKASYMAFLFYRRRVGFLIDAAVLGFAVGAGFSFTENLYFLWSLTNVDMGVWVVRGFGTAMMHGGATAIFAVLAQNLTERHTQGSLLHHAPGLMAAIAVHMVFNQMTAMPVMAMGVVSLIVPAVLFLLFAKSEHAVHNYLLAGHELHERILVSLDEGFLATPEGKLIADIVLKFRGDHLKSVIEYIRLHTELVILAEEVLLAREARGKVPVPADVKRNFARLHALEREIGRTTLLALWPHLKFSRREMAELYEFEEMSRSPREI